MTMEMEMEMGRRERLKVKYSHFKQIKGAAIKRKVVTLPDPVLETVVKFVASVSRCWRESPFGSRSSLRCTFICCGAFDAALLMCAILISNQAAFAV